MGYLMDDFMKMALNIGRFLADPSNNLKGMDLRVFLSLTSYVQYGGKIKVSQKELAKELGVQQSKVSISITKLEKLNVLSKKRNRFNVLEYRFNPEVIMKGRVVDNKQQKPEKKVKVKLKVIPGKLA